MVGALISSVFGSLQNNAIITFEVRKIITLIVARNLARAKIPAKTIQIILATGVIIIGY